MKTYTSVTRISCLLGVVALACGGAAGGDRSAPAELPTAESPGEEPGPAESTPAEAEQAPADPARSEPAEDDDPTQDTSPAATTGCLYFECGSGFQMQVTKKTLWEPGTYTLRTTIDGAESLCELELPPSNALRSMTQTCTGEPLRIRADERPAELAITRIIALGTPERIAIEIAFDDRVIAADDFTPQYERSYPDDPCHADCMEATGPLEVD
jgi:hypothetical protein